MVLTVPPDSLRPTVAFVPSENALHLQEHQSEVDHPRQLWETWNAGHITDADLRGLISFAWLYSQAPEQVLATERWVAMLKATGVLVQPTDLELPVPGQDLFRAATESHIQRMAWYVRRSDAEAILPRHARCGPAGIYLSELNDQAVLAHFKRADEGQEVLLDPHGIGDVIRID